MFLRKSQATALRRRSQRMSRLEPLESRRLLSINTALSGGILSITGTHGDDVVAIYASGSNIHVFDGSSTRQFAANAVTEIRAYALDGNDQLTAHSSIAKPVLFDGGPGNDSLSGGRGADTLRGREGDDVLLGNDGADQLEGDEGADALHGGAGNDRALGGGGNDFMAGGNGRDELFGEDGDDTLRGGSQDDLLAGGEGNDIAFGSTGNDTLRGDGGNDTLYGEGGHDFIRGGEGADAIWGGVGNDDLDGDSGNDILFGEDGNDVLLGSAGRDSLEGGAGEDFLRGGDSQDTLLGGLGRDTLDGGAGDDLLEGGEGNDSLDGGLGNDVLHGGEGTDTLTGDSGDDRLDGGLDGDLLFGEDGRDLLRGGDGNDFLDGGADADILLGGMGDDSIFGGFGRDLLIGGMGLDRLRGQDDGDVLIGGTTHYDDHDSSLTLIRDVWQIPADYDLLVSLFERHGSSFTLDSQVTVHDDVMIDHLYGDAGEDWFFLPGVVPTHSHGDDAPHDHDVAPLHEHEPIDPDIVIANLDVLNDVERGEAVNSDLPHADNAVMRAEHFALFALVDYDDVTHMATASGAWSNPATWQGGIVPGSGARVLIPDEITVTVDAVLQPEYKTIRVDGLLEFATDVNTELRVDTLVVDPRGTFRMGTAERPIAANVTARVVVDDDGPIDTNWDPRLQSRGVIIHGTASIYGAETTSFLPLAVAPSAGATKLVLSDVPVNWKVGDEIVIAGTDRKNLDDDEVRTILAINGNVVTIAPLKYSHLPVESGLDVHVAHLTRNAVFESENEALDRRGHVMFMHTREVDVFYAGFYHLGRSNKLELVNDPVIDPDGNLVPGTGLNPRGRYSVHFHRNGVVEDGNPARVHGSVVAENPGWGYVNHSSYVEMTDNVAFDVDGAGFVTEAGDEIGAFDHNISIFSTGSADAIGNRRELQDFGHEGDGFWLQGPGVTVTRNVAAGHAAIGFAVFTVGLEQAGLGTTEFLTSNLVDSSIAGGAETVDVGDVPLSGFHDNVAYASTAGIDIRFHLVNAVHDEVSLVEDSSVWGNQIGLSLFYTHQTIFRDLSLLGQPSTPGGVGIFTNDQTADLVYDNLSIVGFHVGAMVAGRGDNVIHGGFFNNLTNFLFTIDHREPRTILITGDIQFGQPVRGPLTMISTYANLTPINGGVDHLLTSDEIILDFGQFDHARLYFHEQAARFVPFTEPRPSVPDHFVGKTNQKLWDRFGVALSGAIAPADTVIVAGIDGLIDLNP